MVDLAISVGQTQTPEAVLFWVLAPLTVAAALAMLLVKKAVHSAILMASVMINLAIFYIAQDALFLGIVQIVVYTGAVMMLFLFILMLVGVDSSDSLTETIPGLRPIAITAAVGFGGLMVSLIGRATLGRSAIGLEAANSNGNVKGIAQLLFSTYVWPFEVVSALLITAALGAMVLAHHQSLQLRPTQRQLSTQRFRGASLANAAGLPAPGVFARHNAVDVPALLPDGTPAANSINATLQARGDMLTSGTFELGKVDTSKGEEKLMDAANYLYLSALLFTIGAVGVVVRRNAIVVFMCVELMLNAANLAFVTFSRINGDLNGQVVAFFTMVVAACEVVVGLAIIVTIYRSRRSASVDDASLLKR